MLIGRPGLRLALFWLFPTLVGCAQSANPSFPTSVCDAEADLQRISTAPKRLHRPLVVIGGFIDPGLAPWYLRRKFESLTVDDRIVGVPLGGCFSFDACRSKVIHAVEEQFPCADPNQNVEVDVIGMSMGGLVARYAALPAETTGKYLRIVRLFTISSPLQGADAAFRYPPLHPMMKPMRRGSDFLLGVNAPAPKYDVYSYVRLGDLPVGVENAAIPGRTPWWVPTPLFNDAHNAAMLDPRILADIARRLRDEPPLTKFPPAPLPGKH